jgi:hypothetical protein
MRKIPLLLRATLAPMIQRFQSAVHFHATAISVASGLLMRRCGSDFLGDGVDVFHFFSVLIDFADRSRDVMLVARNACTRFLMMNSENAQMVAARSRPPHATATN